jgi:hypothetical protein
LHVDTGSKGIVRKNRRNIEYKREKKVAHSRSKMVADEKAKKEDRKDTKSRDEEKNRENFKILLIINNLIIDINKMINGNSKTET